jgi:hypothetical protein
MTIQLNPEQEYIVGQAIRAGLIRAHDEVAEVGVAAIRQRLKARPAVSSQPDVEQWSLELGAWSASHSAVTPLLPDEAIDRDSIYGARGL